jgi:prophage antirepressor-like protein
MSDSTSRERQFAVNRDDQGTVRIVNESTNYTVAALSRREAKRLARELRRVLKNGSKP